MPSSRSALAKGFILELDGLRGIAILLVMVHRFWPRTGVGVAADVAGAGWVGVDLFFVISGFLIAGILLDTRGEAGYFRNFYARRALRIFPLYYLFVVGVFVVFAGNPGFREGAGSPLWYLFHLGNVPEALLDKPVPYWLGPLWSLAIEEQFYLTFPLLVHVLDRRRLTMVLVAMIVLAPAIRFGTMTAMPDQERVQYLFTLCRIDTIAIGCLLAVIVRSVNVDRWRDSAVLVAFCAVPSVVVLGIASGLDRTSPFDRVFGYSLVAIGCASVVGLVVLSRGRATTALLRWAPLTYLGKLCFGLYLLHRPADTLASAAAARAGVEGDLRLMPLKLAVAVVLATISWRVLERPFLHLKDRFASARHPSAQVGSAPPRLPAFVRRALRMIGILVVLLAMACDPRSRWTSGADSGAHADAAYTADASADGGRGGQDATLGDSMAGEEPQDAMLPPVPVDAPPVLVDAPPEPPPPPPMLTSRVLYPEGVRHSPITSEIVTGLLAIAARSDRDDRVFAKVGDSITVASEFLYCFAGGSVDLGAHGNLAPTIAHFMAGDAAGTTPFSRLSFAARSGTMASDALAGNPSPMERELAAIDPQFAIVMFGTNEARFGWSVDQYGAQLWALVDTIIASGAIPILSTIPPNVASSAANARVPAYNRVVRAIAQGRGVPLVDYHRELSSLSNRGISSDGIHPSVAPGGGCLLTTAGLQHGYNVRNLITIEALARARAALGGTASDSSASTRAGSGSAGDPFVGTLPLVDLADTRTGYALVANHGCGGPSDTGHELVYRVTLAAPTAIQVYVVDRAGVDVDVHLIAGTACLASGDSSATAVAGPGTLDIVVDARSASTDGEFLLVVQQP